MGIPGWLSLLLIFAPVVLRSVSSRRQVVEDSTKKQLEEDLKSEDYLAVAWYAKNCKTCDRVVNILETKTPELVEAGFKVVKVNDKKLAKQHGVLTFPGLTFFKTGKGSNFEGDLSDGEAIVNFLTSPEAMNLPDLIEEVNAKQLEKLIQDRTFIAVFFYNAQPDSLDSLTHLENIDDNADKIGISFVKINDLDLVDEYGLTKIPSLVYYRHHAPILYEGEFTDEESVLDWLVRNRATGEEDEVIEEVNSAALDAMISSVEHLAVLFYDAESRKADLLLESLEKIDDDCDAQGIHFVKISGAKAAEEHGVSQLPRIVFYRKEIPNVFEGDLTDELETLDWLVGQAGPSAIIEEVTAAMLGKLVAETRQLVVLFCKYLGYVVIAVTHTCYLLRHYKSSSTTNSAQPPPAMMPPPSMLLQAGGGGAPLSAPASPRGKNRFLPPQVVKGLAHEA